MEEIPCYGRRREENGAEVRHGGGWVEVLRVVEGNPEPEKWYPKAQGLQVAWCGYDVGAMKVYMCLQWHGEEALMSGALTMLRLNCVPDRQGAFRHRPCGLAGNSLRSVDFEFLDAH